MSSFSAVLASWPVQLGLVLAIVLAACALMDLTMRAFTGSLRRERRVRSRRRRPVRLRTPPRLRTPVRRRAPVRPAPAAEPRRRPLQAIAADLRRLRRELALVATGTAAARRAGLQAAYDDVLVEAASALEVPHRLRESTPGEERELERLRLDAALSDAGLVLTDPGARG